MSALQQDFDLLAFTISAHQHATESAYQAQSMAPRMMPLAPRHQNFEQLQAHARDRLVRQVCADALHRVLVALDRMHLFLRLVQSGQNAEGVHPDVQSEIQAQQHDFEQMNLSQKLDLLNDCFAIRCPLAQFVRALELAFDALVHHRSKVKIQHFNQDSSLMLSFKKVCANKRSSAQLEDTRLVFFKDEAIVLEPSHLQQILITVSIFVDQLFRSVAAYTQARVDG